MKHIYHVIFFTTCYSTLLRFPLSIVLCLIFLTSAAYAQPEMTAWGNITGIRVEGQLMEFETSLQLVGPDWSYTLPTYKERQRPQYR